MGRTLRKSYFMMARAKQMAPNVKEIGSKYMEKDAILVTNAKSTARGTTMPDAIRIDCLEKKPAFRIEKKIRISPNFKFNGEFKIGRNSENI
jgi:hypothetical protein